MVVYRNFLPFLLFSHRLTTNIGAPFSYYAVVLVLYEFFFFILQIIINDGIVYRDEPWHASCFRCVECQKQLSNIPFTSHDNRPYCRECNANLFAPKCDICKLPIIGLFVFFSLYNHHHQHFIKVNKKNNNEN